MNQKSDWWIPYTFLLFFLFMFSVLGIFAFLAEKTYNGVVVENAYKKGTEYNKLIDENEAQKKLGWHTELKLEKIKDDLYNAELKILNRYNQNVYADSVALEFIRPTSDKLDFTVSLNKEKNIYSASFILPAKGLWEIRSIIKKDDITYKESQRKIIGINEK